MKRFANNFHSWLRHSWKLLANRLTRDPKIVIHGNSCIILYVLHVCVRVYYQLCHCNGVIMSVMVSQITGVSIVCSTVGSDVDQRKHQSLASLAFVRGIHRSSVNSPHKGPVTRKCFHLMTSSWCVSVCLPVRLPPPASHSVRDCGPSASSVIYQMHI